MTLEIVAVVLTGFGVLLGVWRIQAHYETRNETAHTELRTAVAALAADVKKIAEDVAYLRGRQDERDRA